MEHAALLKKAEDAIEELFSDMSVGPEKTRESLEELAATIEGKLDSLPEEE